MKLLDKFLMLILTLVVIAISVLMIGLSANLFVMNRVLDYVSELGASLEAGLIGVVLILFSLRILVILFQRKIKETMIAKGKIGNVKITLKAINKLVKSVANNETKVKKISSKVKADKSGGVSVALSLTVPFGTNITELTGFLQQKIKEEISESTGAKVNQVEILVEEIKEEQSNSDSDPELDNDNLKIE